MTKNLINQDAGMKKPIEPTLKKMAIYDKESFPLRKMKIVRSTTTYLKSAFGLVFKTKQVNDQGIIEVTRIA